MQRRWYKGDTHLHTTNSDGHLTQAQLVERCKSAGLEWIIITDHNFDTLKNGTYSSDGLTVIRGQEITVEAGHVNVWGVKVPHEPPYDIKTTEDYVSIINDCNKAGAVTCANHPFCSNCGFTVDVDALPVKCIEVWNTIQHSDNVKNKDWWVSRLLKGEHIAAVGGSDFHGDIAFLDMLAMPTTIVNAKSNSAEDILEALVEGRSVITNKPGASMIYLNVDDAAVGDTVSLGNGLTGTCKVTNLPAFFTLKIFNNDKLVYSHKAIKKEKEHCAVFSIKEKGFIRAEIDFRLASPAKKVVGFAENKYMSARSKKASPTADELFWAFTNPIWIE